MTADRRSRVSSRRYDEPAFGPVPHDEQPDAGRQPVEVALELVLLGGGLDRRKGEGRLLVRPGPSGAPHDEQNRASSGF